MGREWKPGDVASTLTMGCQPAFRTDKGWAYIDGSTNGTFADEYGFRPLVVIDPEDREQVERLTRAYWRTDNDVPTTQGIDNMQAVLREFANPTPPRPDEPTGIGAVVEDAEGNLWIRRGPTHYIAAEGSSSGFYNNAQTWGELSAVRVLSEGVTGE